SFAQEKHPFLHEKTPMLVAKMIVAAALTLFGASGALGAPLSGRLFVIDPGHGARTPEGEALNGGAVSASGLSEAAINLRVGEKVAALLRADGARVVLTRSFLHPFRIGTIVRRDNRARAALANRLGATAFIAIHCDSSKDPSRHGYSVFWLHRNSQTLAHNMRVALGALRLGESQFRQRELAVTSEARVPAVLVELGFISNPAQAALLRSRPFEDVEARAIQRALEQTFGVSSPYLGND
nr:N-acetylmuramoyl-L-alanine amidase [Candidatus Eremiobacteraeota bacterium]